MALYFRAFDIAVSCLAIILCLVPLVLTALFIKLFAGGPVLYWSQRVGKHSKIFRMPKLRTMAADTPQLATDKLQNPGSHLILGGWLIRRLSIDEIPQLYSVLKGDMSVIGPRPALYNQYDLISLRKKLGVDEVLPGITGWAQINGRDELSIKEKCNLDSFYVKNKSIALDFRILLLTALRVISAKSVSH